MTDKKPKFDVSLYNAQQILEMVNCWMNRHFTRVKHSCNDEELTRHPEWLYENFIESGGAAEFEKRRKEFKRLCEHIDECVHGSDCELSEIISGWMHCPIRKKRDRCMKCQTIKQGEN